MPAEIVRLADRRARTPLRLEQKLRASLTVAPSDWQGRRVLVRALLLTGRVVGWCEELRLLAVVYDTGECGFHDAASLDRLAPNGGSAA